MHSQEFYNLLARRNSTRIFQDSPVDRVALERVLEAAVSAPTSCNRQLWHFVVIDDPKVKRRVSRLSNAQQSYLYDAPILLAVFYDHSLELKNPCRTPYVSASLAIGNILLAAEAEGLGAIYLGGIRNPSGVAQAVEAPDYLVNLGVIAIGNKGGEPPSPPRRPLAEVLSYNRCDLPEKHFPADIRPHLWSLRQLADFRAKLIWYKGVHVDALTLHANPDQRLSPIFKYMSGRIGILLAMYERPSMLDTLSLGGDLVYQIRNTARDSIEKLYAYDLSPDIIDFMEVNFPDLAEDEKVCGLVNSENERIVIPLPDGSLDLLTCYKRLEHFHDPSALILEWHRVLKPGGRAFVVVSNRFYPHLYRYKRMRKGYYALGRNWNFGPERKYEPREVERLFAAAGFRVERLVGLEPIEKKLTGLLERLLEWVGLKAAAARAADAAQSGMFVNQSRSKRWSGDLAYEIIKD